MEQDKKKSNKTLIILVIIIGVLLAALIGIKVWNKYKEKKALQETDKQNLSEGTGQQQTQNQTAVVEDFPLEIGSSGDRVKALQRAINKIAPVWKLKEDGNFGKGTYDALITGVGTKYYPVTLANYTEILKKSLK